VRATASARVRRRGRYATDGRDTLLSSSTRATTLLHRASPSKFLYSLFVRGLEGIEQAELEVGKDVLFVDVVSGDENLAVNVSHCGAMACGLTFAMEVRDGWIKETAHPQYQQ